MLITSVGLYVLSMVVRLRCAWLDRQRQLREGFVSLRWNRFWACYFFLLVLICLRLEYIQGCPHSRRFVTCLVGGPKQAAFCKGLTPLASCICAHLKSTCARMNRWAAAEELWQATDDDVDKDSLLEVRVVRQQPSPPTKMLVSA